MHSIENTLAPRNEQSVIDVQYICQGEPDFASLAERYVLFDMQAVLPRPVVLWQALHACSACTAPMLASTTQLVALVARHVLSSDAVVVVVHRCRR